MLSNGIKDVVRETFPKTYQRAQEALTQHRLKRVAQALERKHGLIVQSGPFAGMTYVSEAVCSSLVPKLLGSYEAELHEVLREIFEKRYETIIDVGCAEGYYAIGLALQFPDAKIYAFDINARARQLCERLASANNVKEQLLIEGECDHERLRALTSGHSLIICDCEGCELDLLRPDAVQGLKKADLLVELHDMVIAGITQTIVERFSDTHKIKLIDSNERDPSLFPALADFALATQRTAVAEFRDAPMQWAYMQSRAFNP